MRNSHRSTILLALSLITITFLTAVLPEAEFHDGIPIAETNYTGEAGAGWIKYFSDFKDSAGLIPKMLSFTGIPVAIFILIIFAVAMVVSDKIRTKVILNLLAAFAVALIFYLIFLLSVKENAREQGGEMIRTGMGSTMAAEEPVPEIIEEIIEPEIPESLSYLFSIITLLLFLIAALLLFRKIRALRIRKDNNEDLKIITEKALHSFESGDDFPEIILRCYNDMVRHLSKETGIIRAVSMTPGEFQSLLLKEGLPRREIEKLTSLFERVRYGKELLSGQEEKEAEMCLKSVIFSLENR